MKFEDPIVRQLLADAAALFDEHVFMTRSMKDIIWGYRDVLLNITKTVDPEWFYTDTIGYFMNVRKLLSVTLSFAVLIILKILLVFDI